MLFPVIRDLFKRQVFIIVVKITQSSLNMNLKYKVIYLFIYAFTHYCSRWCL